MTANRPELLKASVHLFFAQDYRPSQLLILDDGNEPITDWLMGGYGLGSGVQYYHEPAEHSLGEKHNRLVCLARGDIIIPWADDDYNAPWRIDYQVGLLEQSGADICMVRNPLSIDAERKLAWHVAPPGGYLAPATMVYRRKIWERCPYEDVASGEDNGFLDNQRKHGATIIEALDYRCFVQRIHRTNTASREQAREQWQVSFEDVKAVVGKDWEAYFGGQDGLPR